jgi:hypothetical protein
MKRLAIIACLMLSACQTTTDMQTVCLPMHDFTAVQPKLVKEWVQLKTEYPDWATTQEFIPDAVTLRDENRAACAKAVK